VNQFFNDKAKTCWALSETYFICVNYKVLTIHGEGEQRTLKRHDPKTPQSAERKRLRFLKFISTKDSLLRLNYNENAGKQTQKYSKKM